MSEDFGDYGMVTLSAFLPDEKRLPQYPEGTGYLGVIASYTPAYCGGIFLSHLDCRYGKLNLKGMYHGNKELSPLSTMEEFERQVLEWLMRQRSESFGHIMYIDNDTGMFTTHFSLPEGEIVVGNIVLKKSHAPWKPNRNSGRLCRITTYTFVRKLKEEGSSSKKEIW